MDSPPNDDDHKAMIGFMRNMARDTQAVKDSSPSV